MTDDDKNRKLEFRDRAALVLLPLYFPIFESMSLPPPSTNPSVVMPGLLSTVARKANKLADILYPET